MKILRPANLPARWDSVSDARRRLWRTRCCANLLRPLGEDSLALLARCCSLLLRRLGEDSLALLARYCSLLLCLLSTIRCHFARWDSVSDARSRLVFDARSRLFSDVRSRL